MSYDEETPTLAARLLAWYAVALLGLWILQINLVALTDFQSNIGGTVASLFAATVPGDIYFRRTRRPPSNGFGWRMAIGFALVSLAVTGLQAALSRQLGNPQTRVLAENPQFLLALLFLHLVVIGPFKWVFGLGASFRQRVALRKARNVDEAK